MDIKLIWELSKKHNKCKSCGSDRIDNVQNVMFASKGKFIRKCSCGWSIKLNC